MDVERGHLQMGGHRLRRTSVLRGVTVRINTDKRRHAEASLSYNNALTRRTRQNCNLRGRLPNSISDLKLLKVL